MIFPLSLQDLSLWLAIIASVLVITLEVISPQYGRVRIFVDKRKLRKVALIISILFSITSALNIISMFLSD